MKGLDERIVYGNMLCTIREDSADQYGKVSIKEASLRSGLSPGYISDIEKGRKVNVSIESLQRLAMAYGCHLHMEFIRIERAGIRTRYDILEDPSWLEGAICVKDETQFKDL